MSKLSETIYEIVETAKETLYPQNCILVALIAISRYDQFQNLDLDTLADLGLIDSNLAEDILRISRNEYNQLRTTICAILGA